MNETYESIMALVETFQQGHNAGTKVGAGKARKSLGEIKKLVTQYRKESVDESK